MMTRLIYGTIVMAALLACPARDASAQAAAAWPSAGARMIRVEESQVPATPMPSATVSGPASPKLAIAACATKVRDAKSGREFLLQKSTVRQSVDNQQSAGTTTTTTQVERAVGEYARLEPSSNKMSSRVVKIDCATSRVIASGKAERK